MEICKTARYMALIFILLLGSWLTTIECKDDSYSDQAGQEMSGVENANVYEDSESGSPVNTKERQSASLNSREKRTIKKFSQTDQPLKSSGNSVLEEESIGKKIKRRKVISKWEIPTRTEHGNLSEKVACIHGQETINSHEEKARRERAKVKQMPVFSTQADSLSYVHLKRQRRQPNSVSFGPTSKGSPHGTPEGSPEGSPERSHTGLPETALTTAEPEPDPEMSWPEPEPDWPEALKKWKVAWPLHTYGLAAIFTVLALVPPLELLRMILDKTRKSALKLSLLVMIFLFCATRAIALFVDPYGSAKRLNLITNQLLVSLGHPCIISALSLLLLVLIDTTKMNVAPPRFQRVQFIVPVVTLHVALVLITDFVVAYFLEAKVLLLMCQIYFLVLGFLLTAGYSRVGWKIRMNAKANKSSSDNGMKRLQYLITACAVTSALLCALTIYAAAGVFGIYSDVKYVDAWPWWIFQTSNRVLEIAISVVILLMNTKTTSRRKIFPVDGLVSMFRSKKKPTTELNRSMVPNYTSGGPPMVSE